MNDIYFLFDSCTAKRNYRRTEFYVKIGIITSLHCGLPVWINKAEGFNDPLSQSHSPPGKIGMFLLDFESGNGRTDNMFNNSDHFWPSGSIFVIKVCLFRGEKINYSYNFGLET